MKNSRCVGLVGGLGVGATVHYYEQLARGCEKFGFALDIVITHAQTPLVFAYVEARDRTGLAEYLNGYIQRTQAAGAEMAAITAITPLFCAKELAATSALPIVSLLDPLNRELAMRKARRVAIFGTRFVIESDMFGTLSSVEVVRPAPDEVDMIHNTYVDLAATGEPSAEKHKKLTSLAHRLVARDAVDTILLAGTDLTLLFNETSTDFPHVDCAALHIREILRQVTGPES
ncbi:MAG TPA: aspartate/glutamate racemase family protein [Candidatus Sulfotelmatobacter sp.]|nr:aspartate/glutamate racemase family protein [Candidatus Sulfotelmatobacter sp.]